MLPCSAFWHTPRFRLPNAPSQTCRRRRALWGCNGPVEGGARDQRAFHPFLTL